MRAPFLKKWRLSAVHAVPRTQDREFAADTHLETRYHSSPPKIDKTTERQRSRGRRAWRLRIRPTSRAPFSSMCWPLIRFWMSAAIATSPITSRRAAATTSTIGQYEKVPWESALQQWVNVANITAQEVFSADAADLWEAWVSSDQMTVAHGLGPDGLPYKSYHSLPQSSLGALQWAVQQGVHHSALSDSRSCYWRLRLLDLPSDDWSGPRTYAAVWDGSA